MGDFNFDLLNYETDTGTAGFLNLIVQFGFLPLIHQPTRITDRSATIIDIFADNFEHESLSGNLFLKISDHLPQFSIIKSFTWIIKPSTTTCTNMTAINLMKISLKMIF